MTSKKTSTERSAQHNEKLIEVNEAAAVELGAVNTCNCDFDTIDLQSGGKLSPVRLAYETYGELNDDASNAILICHALTGDAHAAGINEKNQAKGWWDYYVGPNKPYDTNQYFIICSNVIGGCQGSTGPSSINPENSKPYALEFPVITIRDMVTAQAKLIEHLGIKKLLCVAGGSMGGMQALQWPVSYPERVQSVITIAAPSHHSPQQIAFNEVGRQSIMRDPNWNKGDYYNCKPPDMGLSIARMIGHITYMSDDSLQAKFSRNLQGKTSYEYILDTEFQVESYLQYQGDKFVERFDANSYIYITRAVDYFDLAEGYSSLSQAFAVTESRFLFLAFSSDWLYPSAQVKELARAAKAAGKDAVYLEIKANHGHDSFLLPNEVQYQAITGFLKTEMTRRLNENR